MLGGLSIAALAACGDDGKNDSRASATTPNASSSAATSPTTTAPLASCDEIPEETGGPYPGDGSNGPNALTESGIVRSDIRSSFGSATATAPGVPTTVTLTIVDLSEGCIPLEGAAVYLWHCDRDGEYSMYGAAITDQNYLRGVQASDKDGRLTFTTIFPACYSGRWPHMHFEVYPSLDAATSASEKLRTSQLALPQDICETVFSTADGYSQSVTNLSQVSLNSDNVFSDGYSLQMASVTGSVADGYTIALTVAV
jgi:protocatechuate 3,4-dioxygenase beta subunit